MAFPIAPSPPTSRRACGTSRSVAVGPRAAAPPTSPPRPTRASAHGYPANAAVRPQLLQALGEEANGFVFGHLNESDTAGHDNGPESEAARACYRATDQVVGELLNALAGGWAETVIMIVSDHDMQSRNGSVPIDPMAHNTHGWWDAY